LELGLETLIVPSYSFLEGFQDWLSSRKFLTKLKLNFKFTVSAEGEKENQKLEIFDDVSIFKSLTSFRFLCQLKFLDKETFPKLLAVLASMPLLNRLELSIKDGALANKHLLDLMKFFSLCQSLQHLTLKFT